MSEETNTSVESSFKDELELIDKEMKSVDDLFQKIMKEIEDAKKPNEDDRNARYGRSSSNPYTYLYNMFANANSVKSNKISLISQRVAIKKVIEDLKIKNKNNEGDENKFRNILSGLIKQISDENATERNTFDSTKVEKEVDDEDELNRMADEAFKDAMDKNPKEIHKEEENEEQPETVDESKLAISTDGRLFLMNDNDEIEEELEFDKSNYYLEYDEDSKTITYAKTIDTNKEIQIIEVEE